MSQRRQQLLTLLESLRAELSQVTLDEARAAELTRLIDAMEEQIPAQDDPSVHPDLLEELNREATSLEVDHPDTVATVRTLINMLSNLGI
ncbi:MAG: DUF4404 family protein [Pseudomonadota bacterium]